MTREAEIIYKDGIKRSKKKDPLYEILQKQLNTLILNNSKLQNESNYSSNPQSQAQGFQKGHFLSLSESVIKEICAQFADNKTALRNFACTSRKSNLIANRSVFIDGIIDLKRHSSIQNFSQSMKEFDVLANFNQFSTFSVGSETSTEFFLLFSKKNLSNMISCPKIYNLELGSFRGSERIHSLFRQCLQQGLGKFVKCLKLDFNFENFFDLKQIFEKCKLKEFSIKNFRLFKNNNDDKESIDNLDFKLLESLIIDGDAGGCQIFSNCKSLKYLNYPTESDFNSYLSEKLVCVNLRYEENLNMRPRPIKHLGLNSHKRVEFIDLTKYSYESIETLHLENINITDNNNNNVNNDQYNSYGYIKSSCWNQLITLRLKKVLFKDIKLNFNLIFRKSPKLRILELNSIPLAGLKDFNIQENGIWLIELIFESFPNLEQLIFIEISLSPSAISLLIKKLNNKVLKLKIFGLIGASKSTLLRNNLENNLYQTFKTNYPWSYLITNETQYKIYCEKFNLFYGNNFLLINH